MKSLSKLTLKMRQIHFNLSNTLSGNKNREDRVRELSPRAYSKGESL
ncbi:hypothetical protein COTS27_01014 [Spirochaetota bacterium]|nr:hypothetical protein COTS27_01014 [Spirochaetota bacterium]